MKKAIVFLLIFLMLILSACAGQTSATQAAASTPAAQVSAVATQSAPASAASTGAAQASSGLQNPPPGSNGSDSTYTITAAYSQDGGSETKTGQTYTAANADESAIYVNNSGALTLANASITTSGNTSSQDNSSFHGLNAAVLAAGGSTISLSDSTITTSGTGANGAFATDSGSSVTLSKVTIQATADGGHGVMATNGGSMTLTDVNINTAGTSSGAIATDRGGGTINVTGGTVTTSGKNSPAIYSTGAISVSGGTMTASGAEAAVIEGGNSITLTDTSLSSTLQKWGVMIYQSMSGDAEGTKGTFTMTGGSLAYTPTSGPLFYVTNSTGVITLKGVKVTSGSGILVKASAGDWGNSGSNGGTVIFTADGQTLTGDLVADSISAITLTLQNGSSLTGTINADHTAKSASLTLDATSSWTVTGDSTLTSLTDASGISGTTITNITGNGHTVYYDASASPALNGQTYTLNGGGYLKPAS